MTASGLIECGEGDDGRLRIRLVGLADRESYEHFTQYMVDSSEEPELTATEFDMRWGPHR